ncbi:MAG: phosphoribosyltransferase, partial [Candidatus Omnitrophota bacterium]
IVVGSPLSVRDIASTIKPLVDELVILEKPPFFQAVAQVYRNWYDVPDKEVIEIMKKYKKI